MQPFSVFDICRIGDHVIAIYFRLPLTERRRRRTDYLICDTHAAPRQLGLCSNCCQWPDNNHVHYGSLTSLSSSMQTATASVFCSRSYRRSLHLMFSCTLCSAVLDTVARFLLHLASWKKALSKSLPGVRLIKSIAVLRRCCMISGKCKLQGSSDVVKKAVNV